MSAEQVILAIGTVIGAAAGGPTITWLLLKDRLATGPRAEALAKDTTEKLNTLKDETVKDLKTKIETHVGKCCGKENERRINVLESEMKARQHAATEISRQIAGMQTTLTNQISAFLELSSDLKKYVESTTRQDERIKNNAARIGGLHEQFRKHTDRREIHHG